VQWCPVQPGKGANYGAECPQFDITVNPGTQVLFDNDMHPQQIS